MFLYCFPLAEKLMTRTVWHLPLYSAGLVMPAFAVLLAGCVTLPPVQPPLVGPGDAAQWAHQVGVSEQAALSQSPVPRQWWALFNDPTLTALEAEIEANLDLQAASLRIEESRARLGLTEAARRPQLFTEAGYSRDAISKNSGLHRLGQPTSGYDTWSLGLQASWELDFWGHLQNQEESARANLDAAWYGQKAAQVSVAAEVARSYLLLRSAQAQLELVTENLQIAAELVRLADSRERNGVATRFDIASARADAAGLQARYEELQHQSDALKNSLALLLGKPPHAFDRRVAVAELPPMPARLPIGIPSELAQRRPDVLQAEARFRAAVADIGAAKSDFYPRISLTGNLGVQAFNLSDLGSWGSRRYSVGPTLYLPIFDGGRLSSQLALTETRHRLAGIAYQQTVLRAWHEVDNALSGYSSELRRHEQLELALTQNRTALEVAQRGYRQGTADFTSVLMARRSLLASQYELNDCATASALAVVALYRALGGGWSSHLQDGVAGGRI